MRRPFLLFALVLAVGAWLGFRGMRPARLPESLYADRAAATQAGAFALGWLRAATPIGAVVMALVLAHRPAIHRTGRALLLSVAAVPGSIFPQRTIDPGRVGDYLVDNPTTGPWLDRLGFFNVYTSPWFSAIYLLLFVSLVGCIVPRTSVYPFGCSARNWLHPER